MVRSMAKEPLTPLKRQARNINVRNGLCLKAKLVLTLMRNREEKIKTEDRGQTGRVPMLI